MATVTLNFVPPDGDDWDELHIYESASSTGPFVLIETVTAIGTPPTYITSYTTNLATSDTDWFAIAWQNTGGDQTRLSPSIQAGTTTVVAEVVRRVTALDSSVNEIVATQEAEAVIQTYLGVDPYDPTLMGTVTYSQLQGLAHLVLARVLTISIISTGQTASATIGLVSMKSGTQTNIQQKNIEMLLELANKELGIATSFVMLLEDIRIGSSISSWTHDQSRLVIEVGTG